jgi:hypothetical protein
MLPSNPAPVAPERIHGIYGFYSLGQDDIGKPAIQVITSRTPVPCFAFWRGTVVGIVDSDGRAPSDSFVQGFKAQVNAERLAVHFYYGTTTGEHAHEIAGTALLKGAIRDEELIAPTVYTIAGPCSLFAIRTGFGLHEVTKETGLLVRVRCWPDDPRFIAWAKAAGYPD